MAEICTVSEGSGSEMGADMSTTSIEPVSFPYRCVFVPRRGRIRYAAYFHGEGYANVRRVPTNGTQLAFRLHFPEKLTRHHVRPATTLDVRRFQQKLWWPLTKRHRSAYPGEKMSAGYFLEALHGGLDFFGLNRSRYPTWKAVATKEALAQAKEKDETEHDNALAQLQRKMSEHILLIGDTAYAAGGEPVYVQRKLFRERKETTIASLGCDRAVDQRVGGLQFPPGQCGNVDEALQRGAFQFPGEAEQAEQATRRFSRIEEMPKIEVLASSAAWLTCEEVRVDALFRFASNPRRPWNCSHYVSPETRIATAELGKVAAADPDSATTSRDRFVALVRFADFIDADEDGSNLKHCADFRYLERNLSAIRNRKLSDISGMRRTNCPMSRARRCRYCSIDRIGGASPGTWASRLGCYFSMNGAMLSNDRHRAMVASLPLDKLLTETDEPFTRTIGKPTRPDVKAAVEALALARQIGRRRK